MADDFANQESSVHRADSNRFRFTIFSVGTASRFDRRYLRPPQADTRYRDLDEVVDEISAHEGLHGRVDRAEIHLLLGSFVAINLGVELWDGGQIRRNRRRDFRSLRYGSKECRNIVRQEFRVVVAGTILKDHRDAPRSAYTGNRRRREREGQAFTVAGQFLLHTRLDSFKLF